MELNLSYGIMRPIQLPWMYVSPSGLKGLDLHLTPDVFVRLEGIISGEQEFVIGHFILSAVEKMEVDELTAEHIWMSEYFPAKSKERIAKAFKDEQNSCFFTMKQMEALQELFSTRNFMAYDVTVFYKDQKIEDIASLPEKEFKSVSKAFDELDVFRKDSWKDNKVEYEAKREQVYHEKTAELEQKQKKGLWEKVRGKGFRKRVGIAFCSAIIGVAGFIAQRKLAERGGPISLIAAMVVGTIGVFAELYGRHEANETLKKLQYEGRAERVAF